MAELSCPVTGCKYVVNGISREDVLRQMEKHRKLAHGRKEVAEERRPRRHDIK